MKISQSGIDFIKSFEGLRLHAYDDGGGVWTIGYGSTNGGHQRDAITELEAGATVDGDVAEAEDAVNMFVEVDLHNYEFDALVSFTFNCGVNAFHGSTLLRLLNDGDREGASKQFIRWNKDNGKVVAGLTRRREAETRMFRGGDED